MPVLSFFYLISLLLFFSIPNSTFAETGATQTGQQGWRGGYNQPIKSATGNINNSTNAPREGEFIIESGSSQQNANYGSGYCQFGTKKDQNGNTVCRTQAEGKDDNNSESTASSSCPADLNSIKDSNLCKQCGGIIYKENGVSGCIRVNQNSSVDPQQAGLVPSGEVSAQVDACTDKMIETSCQSAMQKAETDCNSNNAESEINNAAKVATQLLGAKSATDIKFACSTIGKLSTGANGTLTYFSQKCNFSRNSCLQTCGKLYNRDLKCNEKYKAYTSKPVQLKVCENLDARTEQAQQSMMGLMQTANNMTQCATQSNGNEFCLQFPNNVACHSQMAQDCNNPTFAAANKACICIGNPQSEQCRSAQKAAGVGSGPTSADLATMKTSDMGLPSSLASSFDKPEFQPAAPAAPGEDPGGQKGSRALGGGPQAGSGNKIENEGQNHGAHESEVKTGGGFMSSSGGGGSGSGLSGFASSVGQTMNRFFGGSSGTTEKGPDLRNFLPGGKFEPPLSVKMRGLAGSAGPDGITGPHSDIWTKIKNRYQEQSYSLMP